MSETLTLKFNSAYSPSIPVKLDTSAEKSRTKQSFQKECDINTIMSKYKKTGILEHNNSVEGRYGDFVTQADYHSAMNDVLAADDAFASLPSSIRSRFHNDPGEFLEFTQNDENYDDMREMGLLTPEIAKPVVDPDDHLNAPAPVAPTIPVSAPSEPTMDPS